MQIGLAAMKCYFAEKGTGDIGDELQWIMLTTTAIKRRYKT